MSLLLCLNLFVLLITYIQSLHSSANVSKYLPVSDHFSVISQFLLALPHSLVVLSSLWSYRVMMCHISFPRGRVSLCSGCWWEWGVSKLSLSSKFPICTKVVGPLNMLVNWNVAVKLWWPSWRLHQIQKQFSVSSKFHVIFIRNFEASCCHRQSPKNFMI